MAAATRGISPKHHALLSMVLGCASTAVAQPTELYFTEYQFNNPKMKAIGLDGSNLRELFTIPMSEWLPVGLAVDPAAGRIYWSDSAAPNNLMSAGITGTPLPASLTALSPTAASVRGASLDGLGRLYFTAGNTIRRVNVNGTGQQVIYTSSVSTTIGAPTVDATNGHVYFPDPGPREIRRMNLDGTNVKTVVRGVSSPRAIQVDVASGRIFWIDADTITDFVGRANLDGTGFTVISDRTPGVSQSSGLIDLLLHPAGGKLYFADERSGSDQIYSCNFDGTNQQSLYTSPTSSLSPSGLALSTGAPMQPLLDCNGNSVADDIDISNLTSQDCNNNGVPDECEEDACPARVFLLDNGSDPVTASRALGVPSQWEQFQPFDVPAEGWTVGQIGLDGWTSNYSDGSGVRVTFLPDNGSLAAPDELATPLAEIPNFNFLFDADHTVWVYADLNLSLTAGRYWVRVRANTPLVYGAGINCGLAGVGLPSKFRGTSGVLQTATRSLAMRLVLGGQPCPLDLSENDVIDADDIFAFLTIWFDAGPGNACVAPPTGCPGDWNSDGVVTADDIFAFLTEWFAAGPGSACP